jgi:hypothetical protein
MNQGIQNLRNSFLRGFPLPQRGNAASIRGFQIRIIIGNFRIVN